ncbi:hypothetical protein BH11CYA1_BH11CYA1_15580 [soil metagenome]
MLIVEDHLLTRLGLTMVLDAHPSIKVVGEADNGVSALKSINEIEPDVAIIDIGLPQMDGIECTTVIKSSGWRTRVLIRSSHQENDAILAVIAAGADGYCLKDSSDEVLIEAIVNVASGRAWLDARVAGQIQEMFKLTKERPERHREQILALTTNLGKADLDLLNRIADATESSSIVTIDDAGEAFLDEREPDHLRVLLKKIAEIRNTIN